MQNLLSQLAEFEEDFKPENSLEYNKFSPVPCLFDSKISNLIGTYINANSEEQNFIRDAFSHKYSSTFFFFSERMACLAVREKSEKYIFEGLIAHAIENGKFDWRENILILSLLYHSAVKIGSDPIALFNKAAEFAEGKIKEIIKSFPNRAPENRSIETMGYVESVNEQGFCYKRTW